MAQMTISDSSRSQPSYYQEERKQKLGGRSRSIEVLDDTEEPVAPGFFSHQPQPSSFLHNRHILIEEPREFFEIEVEDSPRSNSSSHHSSITDENLSDHLEESIPELQWGKTLGAGGYGTVRTVTSASFENPVALKMLKIESAPEISEDWESQGEVLGLLLNSDRLVCAKGFVTVDPDDNVHFHIIDANFSLSNLQNLAGHRLVSVAYEYIEDSKDLQFFITNADASPEMIEENLSEGIFNEEEVQFLKFVTDENGIRTYLIPDFAMQILEGLEALHDAGIHYRDLRTENILVTKSGNIKLIDWNTLAYPKRTDQKMTSQLIGTPGYMAPEWYDETGKEVDLYAFGVVLHELNYGNFEDPNPFLKTENPTAWHKAVVKSFKDKGAHLDPKKKAQLDNLLSLLFHPNPKRRLPVYLAKQHPYFSGMSTKKWDGMVKEWRVQRKTSEVKIKSQHLTYA